MCAIADYIASETYSLKRVSWLSTCEYVQGSIFKKEDIHSQFLISSLISMIIDVGRQRIKN